MYPFTKRVLDVGGAFLLLLALTPVFCGVAAWIWWDDGQPIFFTQFRAGKHGRLFRIFKFRTLRTGPKDPTRPSSHTTSAGTTLRRWALDELPQLWNVLQGDMSLVGPRPPLPKDIEHYTPRERTRLHVRPGLTGWAQIHGRNAIPWSERIEHDIWYVRNRCLSLDIRILLRTPTVLISGTGVTGPNNRNPSY